MNDTRHHLPKRPDDVPPHDLSAECWCRPIIAYRHHCGCRMHDYEFGCHHEPHYPIPEVRFGGESLRDFGQQWDKAGPNDPANRLTR